ncbi:MAG: lysophospholipid acyltransferase family protein [Rhodocyclaceae bacterium]|nr:lysophospholipid acyltransferase family protein [Rhodocyclaceae bacterium]
MGFLFRLLARLPLPVLHNLGALLGWLIWLLSPTYRRHLKENTAQAGSVAVAARHAAVAETGKSLPELPKLWLRPQDEVVGRVVKVSGWELVEAAWGAGRGILFLTPHLGCFEIAAQYYAAHRPITALYRRPKQAWLAPIMESGRGANLKLAPADLSGVRKLIKALRTGEAVGILPDQVPKQGEGVWAPFFGRPAYTMTLAARLAQTGATVIFAFGERLHYGAGYHLRLFAPVGDVTTPAGINREIERLVLMCPEQYLWGYNRYKGTPPAVRIPATPDAEIAGLPEPLERA